MEEEEETMDIIDVVDVQVDPPDMSHSHSHHSPINVHGSTESSHSQNQLNTSKSYEDNADATELTEGRTITITSGDSTTTTHKIEIIEEDPGADKDEGQTPSTLSTKCLLCLASLTSQEEIHEINQESAESLVCLLSLKPLKSSDSSLTSSSYTEFFQKSKYCGMCSTFLSNIFKYLKSLMFLQEQLAISKAVLVELISENYSEWVKDLVCEEEEHFQNENYSSDKNDELVTIPAEELQVYPALFNEQGDLINDESNSLKHEENTYSYEVEIVDQSGDEQTASAGTSNDPLDLHVRNVAAYPGQQEDNNTLTIILPDHHLQGSHVTEIANGMYWPSDTLGSTSAPTYQGMMQPNVMINATVHENPTIPIINPHHTQSHHGPKSYICNVCHKNFSSSGVLRTHMVIHGDKKFSCAICSKSFFYEHNLRTHAKTHKPQLLFSNNEHQQNQRISSSVNHNYHQPHEQRTPKNSKSLSTRNGNIKNSSTDPSFHFPCPRCNKTFRTKYNLNNHLFLHDNSTNFKDSTSSSHEYSFTCGKCGRQYLSNENLQKHLVVCNIISDKVKYRHDGSSVQHHVMAMNNSNPNYGMLGHHDPSHSHHQQHLSNNSTSSSSTAKCHICDKVFYSENYVKIHMKTHGEEKPFRCGVCSKGFTLRHYLQVHLRVHTGEKPYTCKLCGRNFTQKSSLNTHMRRHESSFNYA